MASTDTTAARVEEVVIAALVEFGSDPELVGRDATFTSLDVDSLDMVELAQVVQDEFGLELTSSDVATMTTVGDAIDLVVARLEA